MKTDLPVMWAQFIVTGMKFDPNECTRNFGVEPNAVMIKGQKLPGKRYASPDSSWSVASKKRAMDSTDEALKCLIKMVWARRKHILAFCEENDLEVTFGLKITGGLGKRNFLYEFSPELMEQMSYFHARVFIDVY
jgi:hypothetical protein